MQREREKKERRYEERSVERVWTKRTERFGENEAGTMATWRDRHRIQRVKVWKMGRNVGHHRRVYTRGPADSARPEDAAPCRRCIRATRIVCIERKNAGLQLCVCVCVYVSTSVLQERGTPRYGMGS